MRAQSFLRLLLIILVSMNVVYCKNEVNNLTEIVYKEQKQVDGIWIDYIFGGPPMPKEFKGIDSLTKKYHINYKRVEFGCEFSDNDMLQKKKYEIENQVYFKKLESKLGKDWKQKFDLELKTLDSLNFRKLKK